MITGVLGTLTNPSSILNSNLKPEIATSYEVGF
jgi:outer membrane receptor protein involved in Fe transport